MSKLWLVARHEYGRNVRKPSFPIALLSMPLIIALIIGLVWLINSLENSNAPIGYVDHSGFLKDAVMPPPRGSAPDRPGGAKLLPLIKFDSQKEAQKALESGEIQTCYVIPPDYRETGKVEMIYLEPPGGNVRRQFWDFMQINWLGSLAEKRARRAVSDCNLVVRWPEKGWFGGREFSGDNLLNQFLPFIIGVGFIILLFVSSGYLMGAMVDEKENRTMEILITSVSPAKLIGGKIVGAIGVGLTQLVIWLLIAWVFIFIGRNYFHIGILENVSLDLRILLAIMIVAIPTFVMFSSLLAATGILAGESHEANQASFLFVVPFWISLWTIKTLIEHPEGPVTLLLSLFPFTSFPVFCIRLSFTRVPVWQIGLAGLILTISAAAALWFAVLVFRYGMLRYGKRLELKEIFRKSKRQIDTVTRES